MSDLTFAALGISSLVLNALNEMGFQKPTEIQEKAIPLLLKSDRDFVGQAQTGTGKTAAFVIPLLSKIDPSYKFVQSLILAPTRELAFQVEKEIEKIGKFTDIRSTCIYGGTSYEKQIKALKRDKPHIVVGTPGRVLDLIKRKVLRLDRANYCVLDEADEMLNMGFFEDVNLILDQLNDSRQLMMFSATMPKAILDLIGKSFHEHDLIRIQKKTLSNEDIDQRYFLVREKHFKEALARLIDVEDEVYGLIFCRTRIETKEVGDDLKKRGHHVEVLHGDMGQAERDHSMRRFKEKKVRLMVCTDVAARGIDVTNLTHVFNYGLPQDSESYVHRIGRTGRAGMKGKAYTIVGPRTVYGIKQIEKHIKRNIDLAKLPSVEELKKKHVLNELSNAASLASSIMDKGSDFRMDEIYQRFEKEFSALTKEELLKFTFSWKFNNTLRRYNGLADIEAIPGKPSKSSDKRSERNHKRSQRRKSGRRHSRRR